MKRLSILILLPLLFLACDESKSIEDTRVENDLCYFNEGVLIEIKSQGSVKHMSCLIGGKAEEVRISNTLYKYVYEMYDPGDTVRCSVPAPPKIERTNKIPSLEP